MQEWARWVGCRRLQTAPAAGAFRVAALEALGEGFNQGKTCTERVECTMQRRGRNERRAPCAGQGRAGSRVQGGGGGSTRYEWTCKGGAACRHGVSRLGDGGPPLGLGCRCIRVRNGPLGTVRATHSPDAHSSLLTASTSACCLVAQTAEPETQRQPSTPRRGLCRGETTCCMACASKFACLARTGAGLVR